MSETVTESGTLRGEVAEEIRALLARRRLSNIALARAIEKSHTYVWRRLNGETAFDLDDLERIAQLLGVTVADLLPRQQRVVTVSYPHAPVERPVQPSMGARPIGRRDASRPGGGRSPSGPGRATRVRPVVAM